MRKFVIKHNLYVYIASCCTSTISSSRDDMTSFYLLFLEHFHSITSGYTTFIRCPGRLTDILCPLCNIFLFLICLCILLFIFCIIDALMNGYKRCPGTNLEIQYRWTEESVLCCIRKYHVYSTRILLLIRWFCHTSWSAHLYFVFIISLQISIFI